MVEENYNHVLDQIKDGYTEIFGKNLVGIYVHGSIALGCFNWHKSDVDVILVVNDPLTLSIKEEVMKTTIEINKIAPLKGIEMSVVLRKHCQNFVYPTPFELHFSNGHIEFYRQNPSEYYKKMSGTDRDLAAHFTIIRHKGIVLWGEAIDLVFGEVGNEDYLDSIKEDIKEAKREIVEHPVYIIFNLCRVLAYKRDGLVLSKMEGAAWGLKYLDKHFHPLIGAAYDSYSSDEEISFDRDLAFRFCDSIMKEIFY